MPAIASRPIDCPRCEKKFPISGQQVGRWVECPHCAMGFAAIFDEPAARIAPIVYDDPPPSRGLPWKTLGAIGVASVAAFLIVVVVASVRQGGSALAVNRPAVSEQGSAKVLAAFDLYMEYGKNRVDADRKFTGKMVQITDVDGGIQKDSQGRYFSTGARMARHATTSGQYSVGSPTPGILIYLDADHIDELSGQNGTMAIRGVCRGRVEDPNAMLVPSFAHGRQVSPEYVVVVDGGRLVRK